MKRFGAESVRKAYRATVGNPMDTANVVKSLREFAAENRTGLDKLFADDRQMRNITDGDVRWLVFIIPPELGHKFMFQPEKTMGEMEKAMEDNGLIWIISKEEQDKIRKSCGSVLKDINPGGRASTASTVCTNERMMVTGMLTGIQCWEIFPGIFFRPCD